METTQHDPNNRPAKGAALFRWILDQRKWEEANRTPEYKARIAEELEKLIQENAERGTPVVML